MSRPVPWLVVLALMGVPAFASAQPLGECATDADCDAGFVCEVVGGSTCAAPGCAPGEECPPPPPCEPEEFRGCVPAPCATDADCGGDLVCLEVGYTECSGGAGAPACAPGEECPPPPPPEEPTCTEHVDRYCGPRYAAPCAVDADCGDGFTCVAAEICTCSAPTPSDPPTPPTPGGEGDGGGEDGGTPMPPPDAPPPVDPECDCAPSDTRYCEPVRVECATASDCPDSWSCEDISAPTDCARPAPEPVPGGGGGGEPPPAPDCGEPPPPELVCLPPYWTSGWGAASDGSREAVDEATGTPGSRPMGPAPAPEPPTLNPEDPSADPGAGASGGGGCSAVPGETGGGLLAIGWLAALWAATRRRRAR
ncbi:MAG: hypothetical protein IT379_34560 [Deltaproteobacteria bacterium]|nr:hypothetical protein [Deltaproteobacteria bacterium]